MTPIIMKHIHYFQHLVVKHSVKVYQFFKPRNLIPYSFLPLSHLTYALIPLASLDQLLLTVPHHLKSILGTNFPNSTHYLKAVLENVIVLSTIT